MTPLVAFAAFATAAGIGFGAIVALAAGEGHAPAADAFDPKAFARPATVPFPADNPPSPEKIALGAKLFADPALSANGKVACATCHDPTLAFADGLVHGKGIAGVALPRHTPTIWNEAWGETYFWDGRAGSLEEQAKGPVENPIEMGETMTNVARRLDVDADYKRLFTAAFPGETGVMPTLVQKAIAAYERTLVSPETRFDRWVKGDASALGEEERRGFALFTGAAGCVNCHQGWAFTDQAFHDIGLPGDDEGRAKVAGLPMLGHAFKTPSLRELAWTAPYMHDGSLPTLDAVLDHYDHGIVERPTTSPDLPRIKLTADQRDDLLAFLATLSSETAPKPIGAEALKAAAAEPEAALAGPAAATLVVTQKNRAFEPAHIKLAAGATLRVVNDDTRTHNVRVFDPKLDFNSGTQEPGQSAAIRFAEPGTYRVVCAIHPTMKLVVEVAPR
jgi:cytochrome c peroxidase